MDPELSLLSMPNTVAGTMDWPLLLVKVEQAVIGTADVAGRGY
jgi:hypothetical protein